jgi:hypothetical protein
MELRVNAKRKYIGELNPPKPKIEDGYEGKGESDKRNAIYIFTFSNLKCTLFDVALKIIIKF